MVPQVRKIYAFPSFVTLGLGQPSTGQELNNNWGIVKLRCGDGLFSSIPASHPTYQLISSKLGYHIPIVKVYMALLCLV